MVAYLIMKQTSNSFHLISIHSSFWLNSSNATCKLATRHKRVDLIRSLVCVHSFHVHEALHYMIIKYDSVTAADFAGQCYDLTTSIRHLALGPRNLSHSALAGVHQLRHKNQMTDHHFAECQHPGKLFLNELEFCNWKTKLLTLEAILECLLIRASRIASNHPCHNQPRRLKHGSCARLEVFPVGQSIVLGDKDIVKSNISILHHSQTVFSFDFLRLQALGPLGHHEALDLVAFRRIPRPNHDVVGKSGIANPSLLAVDEPAALGLGRGRLEV